GRGRRTGVVHRQRVVEGRTGILWIGGVGLGDRQVSLRDRVGVGRGVVRGHRIGERRRQRGDGGGVHQRRGGEAGRQRQRELIGVHRAHGERRRGRTSEDDRKSTRLNSSH